jgi:NCAIR mutase (PurE)-related protein
MSYSKDIKLDFDRETRIGLDEAIFCEGKTAEQIAEILRQAQLNQHRFLLTRLSQDKQKKLLTFGAFEIDYDPISRTGYFLDPNKPISHNQVLGHLRGHLRCSSGKRGRSDSSILWTSGDGDLRCRGGWAVAFT